jgi:alanine racemase
VRPTRARVDLDAIRHNIGFFASACAPAEVCAVVKADGYGHGSIAVSRAALEAGATWLAVALVEEGAVLRKAGIEAPIMLLAQPRGDDLVAAVRWDLRVAAYTVDIVEPLCEAAVATGRRPRVHLKVNTGMNRLGARPAEAVTLARMLADRPELEFEGVWTHHAKADVPDDSFTAEQLARFDEVLKELEAAGVRPPIVHTANSAAAVGHPHSRRDLVRVGISLYGIPPAPHLADAVDLRQALTLSTEVSHRMHVPAGEGVSYGQRWRAPHDTVVVTIPIGYADGVPRGLSAAGGEVLINGRRHPMVGTVTMDQLMIDCGPDSAVQPGDEVVLLGTQGDQAITPWDWANLVGTIPNEIVCGIGPRVGRTYRGASQPPAARS